MIKILGYKIKKITIYATGGVIENNIDINIRSYKLFLISIAGIMMQMILFILPVSYVLNSNIFIEINLSLIIFNLIPIYPLDGYKILLSCIEYFGPYRYIIKISYIVSFIMLFILFIISKNIIVFISLYILNIKFILELPFLMEKFLLERYLYNISYKKKVHIINYKNMYKCRNNYIKCDNIDIEEKRYLSQKYTYFIDI